MSEVVANIESRVTFQEFRQTLQEQTRQLVQEEIAQRGGSDMRAEDELAFDAEL